MIDTQLVLPTENLSPTHPKVLERGPLHSAKYLLQTFSTNARQRHPPTTTPTTHKITTTAAPNLSVPAQNQTRNKSHIRLITIGASHYCEKVRWGLDLLEADPKSDVYYTEDAHPPVLATIATLEVSGGAASMTPMVEYYDHPHKKKRVLYGSHDILPVLCPFLYPIGNRRAVRAIETDLGSRLGPTVRCYLYHLLFQPAHRRVLIDITTRGASTIERILWSGMVDDDGDGDGDNPVLAGMSRVMGIDDGSAAFSLETVRRVFDEVSRRLTPSTGRKLDYLMDTESTEVGFTAADLTFCSLAGPLIGPPELAPFNFTATMVTEPCLTTNTPDHNGGGAVGEGLVIPRELLELRAELRNTIAGQHVLEIYRKHRVVDSQTENWMTISRVTDNSYSSVGGNSSYSVVDGANDDKEGNHPTATRSRVIIPKIVNRDKLPWKSVVTPTEVAAAAAASNGYDHETHTELVSKL